MKLGNLGDLRWFKGTSFWKAVHGSGVYAFKCEYCGYIELFSERKENVEPWNQDRVKAKSKNPIVGGILEISFACIWLFFGGLTITAQPSLPSISLQYALGISGLAAFAFGLFGGICALRRKYFSIALLGYIWILIPPLLLAWLGLASAPPAEGGLSSVFLIGVTFFLIIFVLMGLDCIIHGRREFDD